MTKGRSKLALRSVGLTENPYRPLFRCNQFVLGPEFAPGLEDWTQVVVGPRLKLTAHPALNMVQVENGKKTLTMLGYMLDPGAPEDDDRQILARLLDQFESLDTLVAATDSLGGRWAIVAVEGEEAHLFNDALGLRQVFYTLPGVVDEIFAMSEAALGAAMFDLPVDDAAQAYMDLETFRTDREYKWPMAASAFRGIRRLVSNHSLDLRRGVSRRFWPIQALPALDLDEGVKRTGRTLQGLVRSAANRFDLAVAVTSGIDSRVVLAACKDITDRVSFVTVRQWNMSDISPDIVIPTVLLTKLGLKHDVILAPVTMTPEFAQVFKSNVYLAHDYYGPDAEAILGYFGRKKVVVTGSGGEVTRCQGRQQLPYFDRKRVTPAYLSRYEMYGRNEFSERFFKEWLEDVGMVDGIDRLDLFEWEQCCGSWLATTQLEFDIAWKDIFTPFNSRELLTVMLSVPSRYRKG
ncbi:MAG: hypothetical protein OEQ18_04030, partial [Gammaproteobacteria bacterium]|nr:hypothetical protein [Gammaproteobacteria bacterium]